MIRNARPADRDRLRDLQTNLREPNPALLDYAIEGPPVVLVSVNIHDEPVGYLVAFYDEVGYVAEIAVTPAHRREGRARGLLGAVFDRLRAEGCSALRLTVHPEDAPARQLYESMGFEEVGREESYYGDGKDGITMQREL